MTLREREREKKSYYDTTDSETKRGGRLTVRTQRDRQTDRETEKQTGRRERQASKMIDIGR